MDESCTRSRDGDRDESRCVDAISHRWGRGGAMAWGLQGEGLRYHCGAASRGERWARIEDAEAHHRSPPAAPIASRRESFVPICWVSIGKGAREFDERSAASFVIRASSFILHSSFVIRH